MFKGMFLSIAMLCLIPVILFNVNHADSQPVDDQEQPLAYQLCTRTYLMDALSYEDLTSLSDERVYQLTMAANNHCQSYMAHY